MIALRIIDANSQQIEASLEDELYYIILNWNSTNKSWTMDIHNSGYDFLLAGIACVVNYPLLYQFRSSILPPGELVIAADKDRNGPIPRDGFVTGDYQLVYIPQDEWTRMKAIANAF